jgi:hypothetical protein
MRASQHYITPDSSPRTRLNGFEKGDKSKTGFWLGGNRDLGVLRHAPGAERFGWMTNKELESNSMVVVQYYFYY